MSNEKKKKKLKEIKSELLSSQEVLVKNGLKNLQKHGDDTLIHPLLQAYINVENESLKKEIHGILCSLKISLAEEQLVEALSMEEFNTIQGEILSFIWNSGFEPIDHIHTISKVAINGDYMTALEALTLAENIEGVFQEELVLESTVEIRNHLNDHPKDEKNSLLISLLGVLDSYIVE